MRLAGKIAMITGAGSGFGEGIAKRFAEEGAIVGVLDRDASGAERVATQIGSRAHAISADVSSAMDMENAIRTFADAHGGLDIMVNNAGTTHRNGWLGDVTEEQFDTMAAVNMKAIYLSTRALLPIMTKTGGSIINTASTAALRPRPGLTWYNATKGFVVTATKSMAVELAPHQIRVNCLCPVAGETAMLGLFMGEDTAEKRAAFEATIPLGRLSQPLDIANAALFLASDEAAMITGVALEVDGGRCI